MKISKAYKDIKAVTSKVMDFIYRDLYYTIGYGCVVGMGNGLATLKSGSRFDYGFGEGFVNNFKLGIFLNALYPALFNFTKKSTSFRIYAHLLAFAMNTAFLIWHYYAGTENPVAAVAPCYFIGHTMTEMQVRDIKNAQKEEEENIGERLAPESKEN